MASSWCSSSWTQLQLYGVGFGYTTGHPLESTFLDDFCQEQRGEEVNTNIQKYINMICFGVNPALIHPIWMEKNDGHGGFLLRLILQTRLTFTLGPSVSGGFSPRVPLGVRSFPMVLLRIVVGVVCGCRRVHTSMFCQKEAPLLSTAPYIYISLNLYIYINRCIPTF